MANRLSTASRNAAADAIVDLIDQPTGSGPLKIYSGTQPATGDAAEAGTLPATVTLPKPAFGNAATGTAAGTDPAAVPGVAADTAGWFRIEDPAGGNVFGGSVSATGGSDLTLTTTILVGPSIDITSLS